MTDSFRYFELRVSLSTPSRLPVLLDHFSNLGIPASKLAISEYKSRTDVSYFDKKYASILRLSKRILACPGTFKIKIRTLNRSDWFDKWQHSYRPFNAGKTFRIVPAWIKDNPKTSRRKLRIDPGGAFGSGLHETTRLSLILMESIQGLFQSQLDLGTGTGILSVAGFRLGADSLTAVDLDPLSTEAARKNLMLNGCRRAKIYTRDFSRLKFKKCFDLVTANLHSQILLRFKSRIQSVIEASKFLIVSGILKRDKTYFLKAFRSSPLRVVRILDGRSWTAILYQKRPFLSIR